MGDADLKAVKTRKLAVVRACGSCGSLGVFRARLRKEDVFIKRVLIMIWLQTSYEVLVLQLWKRDARRVFPVYIPIIFLSLFVGLPVWGPL